MADPFSSWGSASSTNKAFSNWGGSAPHYAYAAAPAKSSGNSHLWPDFVSHIASAVTPDVIEHPVKAFGGGADWVGGNFLKGLEHFATHDFYAGPWALTKLVASDLTPYGGPHRKYTYHWDDNPLTTLSHYFHDPKTTGGGLITPLVHDYERKFGGFAPWDFRPGTAAHEIGKDPFGTALDVTVFGKAFGVGHLAYLRHASKAGKVGEDSIWRPALENSRTIIYKPLPSSPGIPIRLNYRAATNFGRVLQSKSDRIREGLPAKAPFSAGRAALHLSQKVENKRFAAEAQVEKAVAETHTHLPEDQVRAISMVIAGQGRHRRDPIQDLIDFREEQISEIHDLREKAAGEGNPTPTTADRVLEHNLTHEIRMLKALDKEAVYKPNPELAAAVAAIRGRGEQITERAIKAEKLSPDQVARRATQEERQVGTKGYRSEYQEAKKTREKVPNEDNQWARKLRHDQMIVAQKARTSARKELKDAKNQVIGSTGRTIHSLFEEHNARLKRLGRKKVTFHQFADKVYPRRARTGAVGKAVTKLDRAFTRHDEAVKRYQSVRDEWHKSKGIPTHDTVTRIEHAGFKGGPNPYDVLDREHSILAGYDEAVANGTEAEYLKEYPLAQYGASFRRPHLTGAAGNESAFTRARMRLTRQAADQSWSHHNKGTMFMRATISSSPEAFHLDNMRQARWFGTEDFFDNFTVPLSGELSIEHALNGGKAETDFYVRTKRGTGTPTTVAVDDRYWQDILQQDEESLARKQAGYVHQDIQADMQRHAGEDDYAWLRRMKQMGIRRVPKDVAELYQSQTLGTTTWRRMFLRNGLNQAWRFLLLGVKPAWSVFNYFTNQSIVSFRYLGAGGARAFASLVKESLGHAAYVRLARKTLGMKEIGLLRTRDVLRSAFPDLYAANFGRQLESQIQHSGSLTAEWNRSTARKVVELLKPFSTNNAVGKLLKAVYKANNDFNVWGENFTRDQAMLSEIRSFLGKQKLTAEDLKRFLDSAKEEDLDTLRGNTLDAMGDYSRMSGVEREYITTYAPFYAWYKTILAITAKWVTRHPERLWALGVMGSAFQMTGNQDYQMGIPLPEFAQNLVPIGDQTGGQQTTVTTRGFNPLQTPLDLLNTAKAIAGDPNASPSELGVTLMGPAVQFLYVATTNKDPFYGGDYSGPLAGTPAPFRAAGSLLQTPQYRTLQQFAVTHPAVSEYLGVPPYQSKVYNTPKNASGFPGLSDGDVLAIAQYFGVPVRYANVENLETRAHEEQGQAAPSQATYTYSPPSQSSSGDPFSDWGK